MKKGGKVRILADNRVGIVEDQLFFSLGGKKHLRVLVGKLMGEKSPVWFDRELVSEKMTEKITVSFRSETGDLIEFFIVADYEKGESSCSVDGEDSCTLFMKSRLEIANLARKFLMSLYSPSNKD